MTDREKLIELLGEDTCHRDGCYDCDYDGDRDACIEYLKISMADHLLANGVTIQEWIPVSERLPEKNNQWVLCLCVGGAMEVLKFDYAMWNWDSQYPRRCYMEDYVTHWMPLPKPPKEVNDD